MWAPDVPVIPVGCSGHAAPHPGSYLSVWYVDQLKHSLLLCTMMCTLHVVGIKGKAEKILSQTSTHNEMDKHHHSNICTGVPDSFLRNEVSNQVLIHQHIFQTSTY